MQRTKSEPQSILIVDDEEPARRNLAAALKGALPRVNIRTARNYKEAVSKFDSMPCDLLLLDMHFSDGPDGLQLLLTLRERPYPFRAVGISAFMDQYAFRAGKTGLDDFIPKPITNSSLEIIRVQLAEAKNVRKREQKWQAFCVMPFSSDFDDRYLFGIKTAAERSGYRCHRIDEQVFTSDILERIQSSILHADVIIADVTGRNPNVYYEIGYAHASGKTVVLLAAHADELIFDTRNMRHIIYEGSIRQLQEALTATLLELRQIE